MVLAEWSGWEDLAEGGKAQNEVQPEEQVLMSVGKGKVHLDVDLALHPLPLIAG